LELNQKGCIYLVVKSLRKVTGFGYFSQNI